MNQPAILKYEAAETENDRRCVEGFLVAELRHLAESLRHRELLGPREWPAEATDLRVFKAGPVLWT